MARTTLTGHLPALSGPGPQYFPSLPLTAGSAQLNFVAGDAANSNFVAIVNGKTMVYVQNVDSAATHTLTIHSTADPQVRTGDITGYALASLSIHQFGPFTNVGWLQASPAGLWLDPSHSAVQFAIVNNP
jgi:hypothetical protein